MAEQPLPPETRNVNEPHERESTLTEEEDRRQKEIYYTDHFRAQYTYFSDMDEEQLREQWNTLSQEINLNSLGASDLLLSRFVPTTEEVEQEARMHALETAMAGVIIRKRMAEQDPQLEELSPEDLKIIIHNLVRYGHESAIGEELLETNQRGRNVRTFIQAMNLTDQTFKDDRIWRKDLQLLARRNVAPEEGFRQQIVPTLPWQEKGKNHYVRDLIYTIGIGQFSLHALSEHGVADPLLISTVAGAYAATLARAGAHIAGEQIRKHILEKPYIDKIPLAAESFMEFDEIITSAIQAIHKHRETADQEELTQEERLAVLKKIISTSLSQRLQKTEKIQNIEAFIHAGEFMATLITEIFLAQGLAMHTMHQAAKNDIFKRGITMNGPDGPYKVKMLGGEWRKYLHNLLIQDPIQNSLKQQEINRHLQNLIARKVQQVSWGVSGISAVVTQVYLEVKDYYDKVRRTRNVSESPIEEEGRGEEDILEQIINQAIRRHGDQYSRDFFSTVLDYEISQQWQENGPCSVYYMNCWRTPSDAQKIIDAQESGEQIKVFYEDVPPNHSQQNMLHERRDNVLNRFSAAREVRVISIPSGEVRVGEYIEERVKQENRQRGQEHLIQYKVI